MRKPLNNVVDTSSTKKPYVTDDFNEMNESVTTKEVEDKGGTTKHSEFEKPYRLNWNQGYMDMQTQHASNFSFPYNKPFNDKFKPQPKAANCEDAWSKCLQELPQTTFDGTLQQQARDCMNRHGFSFDECKEHENILSCLFFNSLCFCIACSSAINPFNGFNCNQKMDDGCQQLVCDNPESSPSFTLNGDDSAPTTLCPSNDICAIEIIGGQPDGKCVKVPDEGCGTKSVSVTDIYGNTQTKKVRMSSGVWVLVSIITYCPNSPNCGCTIISGKSKIVITSIAGCFSPGGGCGSSTCSPHQCAPTPCVNCSSFPTLEYKECSISESNYEWRCA